MRELKLALGGWNYVIAIEEKGKEEFLFPDFNKINNQKRRIISGSGLF